MNDIDSIIFRLRRLALERDRSRDRESRLITITDDEALALLAELRDPLFDFDWSRDPETGGWVDTWTGQPIPEEKVKEAWQRHRPFLAPAPDEVERVQQSTGTKPETLWRRTRDRWAELVWWYRLGKESKR